MKESVSAFEELVKQMGTLETKVVWVTLLDVLAEMAVNIEEQKAQIDRITAQMDVIAKGGKVVSAFPETTGVSSGRPFSIG